MLAELNGTESMATLREIHQNHPDIFQGIKMAGKGRNAASLRNEMNMRIKVHNIEAENRNMRADLDAACADIETLNDKVFEMSVLMKDFGTRHTPRDAAWSPGVGFWTYCFILLFCIWWTLWAGIESGFVMFAWTSIPYFVVFLLYEFVTPLFFRKQTRY